MAYRIKPRVNMVAGTANHGKLVYDVKDGKNTVATLPTHKEALEYAQKEANK